MSSKRKFCDHCKEFVTLRTYRLHADLYSNRASEAVYFRKRRKFREDFNVEYVATCGEAGEVIDGKGNETTSSGTKIFLYLVYEYAKLF